MPVTLRQPLPGRVSSHARPRTQAAPTRACRECVARTAAAALAASAGPTRSSSAWARSPASPLAALGPGGGDDNTAPSTSSTDPFQPKADDPAPLSAALAALRFYKAAISPLLPPSCRFLPTCSEYAASAYRQFGMGKGTVLTAWRLVRCNPWGGRGFDPPAWPPKWGVED